MFSVARVLKALSVTTFALSVLAKPFSPDDLIQSNRFYGKPAISPNGVALAYIQTRYSIKSKVQFTELYVRVLNSTASTPIKVAEHIADARPNPPPSSEKPRAMDAADDADEPKKLSRAGSGEAKKLNRPLSSQKNKKLTRRDGTEKPLALNRLSVFEKSKSLTNSSKDNTKPQSGAEGALMLEARAPVLRLRVTNPVWITDTTLAFLVNEGKSGMSRLYSIEFISESQWTEPHLITTFPVPVSNLQINPSQGIVAFIAAVHNGTQLLEETAEIDLSHRERADTGRLYDNLWLRHWDTFVTPKVPQIHVAQLDFSESLGFYVSENHTARNIIKDTKVKGRLETSTPFTISPKGDLIAFVAKKPGRDYAWKTTSQIYVASIDDTAAEPINPDGIGASSSPSFSLDGTKIAYLQMSSLTYEADRNQIKIYDMESNMTVDIAHNWDRSPTQVMWVDDTTLAVTYNEYGRHKLAKINVSNGQIIPVINDHAVGSIQRIPKSNLLLFDYSALDSPTDLYAVSTVDNELHRLTRSNPEIIDGTFLSHPEDIEFVGSDNSTIHGYLLRPSGFDASKKYPMALIIHGGPQSSFVDGWSNRWNLNVFAGAGFVTVALDPQGSTGYGQKFTDAVRNEWGGKPFESLMLSLNQLLEKHTYIDRQRMTALGASYGGYMVNWINGHTDVFKALVNHDGMFSPISTYYSTEELYFPETEFDGTPFDDIARGNYERWSPERYVRNWKTPTLVIHGEKDYRLPVTEGISTFTALRRQNIPAKFLYFPDENHWVVKPANSLRWHYEVLDWIVRWTSTDSDSGSVFQKKDNKFSIQGST